MNIKLFFEITKEFFELIHPPILEETKVANIKDNTDEENILQDTFDYKDSEEMNGFDLINEMLIVIINPIIGVIQNIINFTPLKI